MINTVLSTAISGLMSSAERVEKAAEKITTSGGALMPEDIVDVKLGEVGFKANTTMIETVREMDEALLKTFDKEV